MSTPLYIVSGVGVWAGIVLAILAWWRFAAQPLPSLDEFEVRRRVRPQVSPGAVVPKDGS